MAKNPITKYIYKTHNRWNITKSINGKPHYFGAYSSLDEAIRVRDKLVENGWQPLDRSEEKKAKHYYRRIHRHSHRYYAVYNREGKYLKICHTIEEALWARDRFADSSRIPRDADLKTDNPYLAGLEYPLPDRLVLEERKTNYGRGRIAVKGPTSFHIYHGRDTKKGNSQKYICACQSIEMAEYVRDEMCKADWDMSQLQRILDDYPKHYTKLLMFYQYISREKVNGEYTGKWLLVSPVKEDGKSINFRYANIEDALYERDFLKEHDWDYDLLVECIDDTANPYYDMALPTYPTRRIRRVRERNYHQEELSMVADLIREGHLKRMICDELDINLATLQVWLGYWGTNFTEFRQIVEAGEDPFDVLEKQELIYQPDLSTSKPSNFNNYVSYHPKKNRWSIQYKGEFFGIYASEKLAHRISRDLQKCNWDKSKLERIQAKHGHRSMMGSRRWAYPYGKGWAVRRKDDDRKMITYWTGKDKRIAKLARDIYIKHGFNQENKCWVNDLAEATIHMTDLWPSTMFGKVTVEDIAYIESSSQTPYVYSQDNGFSVKKNGQYYGYYSTLEQATDVAEFLQDNNWDRELLEAMMEMGEI